MTETKSSHSGICEACGKPWASTPLQSRGKPRRFCSSRCQRKAAYARNPINPERVGKKGFDAGTRTQTPEHLAKRRASLDEYLATTPKKCQKCGDEFYATQPAQKYCSGRCWNSVAKTKRRKLHRICVSPTVYSGLLDLLGDKCNICGVSGEESGRGRLAVDHNHDTGAVRGLLCHRCNTSLGLLYDKKESLEKAIQYLGGYI